MPFGGAQTQGSRWMVASWAGGAGTSLDIRYPTNGQGGTTGTAGSSGLFTAREVIITGIYVLTWDTTNGNLVQITNQAGVDIASLAYNARNNLGSERGGEFNLALTHGFGVRPQADVVGGQTLTVLVSYVQVR